MQGTLDFLNLESSKQASPMMAPLQCPHASEDWKTVQHETLEVRHGSLWLVPAPVMHPSALNWNLTSEKSRHWLVAHEVPLFPASPSNHHSMDLYPAANHRFFFHLE